MGSVARVEISADKVAFLRGRRKGEKSAFGGEGITIHPSDKRDTMTGGSKTASNASLHANKTMAEPSRSTGAGQSNPSIASNHAERSEGSQSTINSLAEFPSGKSGLKRTPTGNRGSLARWHPSEEENKRWVTLSQPEPLSEENIQKSFVKRTLFLSSVSCFDADEGCRYRQHALPNVVAPTVSPLMK